MTDESRDRAVSEFGQRMYQERKRCRYTQGDLAVLMRCARSTIAMVETGKMDSFAKDEGAYDRLATALGGTGAEWKALAERGKAFVLPASGESITEEHRKTGALLAQHWGELSPAAMRAFRQVIAHELSKG